MKDYPVIVSNVFTFGMLEPGQGANIVSQPVSADEVRNVLNNVPWVSAIGHKEVADIATEQLGTPIPFHRSTVKLEPGRHVLYLCQYYGPRLPEGCAKLPEGATLAWRRVTVIVDEEP